MAYFATSMCIRWQQFACMLITNKRKLRRSLWKINRMCKWTQYLIIYTFKKRLHVYMNIPPHHQSLLQSVGQKGGEDNCLRTIHTSHIWIINMNDAMLFFQRCTPKIHQEAISHKKACLVRARKRMLRSRHQQDVFYATWWRYTCIYLAFEERTQS